MFKEVNISCFLKINEEEFLVGTLAKGIFYLNRKGEIISNLTVKEGLQDNFIHRLFLDKKGDVWAAYNNGIGVIKWNSPVQYISNFLGFEGMKYLIKINLKAAKNNNFYKLENFFLMSLFLKLSSFRFILRFLTKISILLEKYYFYSPWVYKTGIACSYLIGFADRKFILNKNLNNKNWYK